MTNSRPKRTSAARTVALLAYDDCQGSAISSLVEVLDIANLYAARGSSASPPLFAWTVVSPDGQTPCGMGGLPLPVSGAPSLLPAPDLIFVPGLHYGGDAKRFIRQIRDLASLCGPWLLDQHAQGRVLAVSCAGAFVLAELGLLDGRKATTSWWLGSLFRSSYPRACFCEGELVMRDGRIFTAGAFTACLDLGLRLVEHFAGPGLALSCSKVMLIHARRESQFPYMTLQARMQHQDELVLRAQSHIRSHIREELTLERLAALLHTTPRTLARRFHSALGRSPRQFIQEVRVDGAKRLLETTDLRFEQIVERIGYGDPSSFRRLFERITKTSPGKYRRMFAAGSGSATGSDSDGVDGV